MHLVLKHFLQQMKILARTPGFWVPTVLLPSILYSFFGTIGTQTTPATAAAHAASFALYGVMGVSFFQFGVGIATERESPWDAYQRLLPGSMLPRTIARVLSASAFSVFAALLVILVARVLSGIRLEPLTLVNFAVVCLVTSLLFALFGVALGYWCSGRAAIALGNLILLPLAYVGGLWLPPPLLPPVIRAASEFTPTRHAGELAWAVVLNGRIPLFSVGVLIFYAIIVAGIAYVGHKRDISQRYV